jgi:hypothetical protein
MVEWIWAWWTAVDASRRAAQATARPSWAADDGAAEQGGE